MVINHASDLGKINMEKPPNRVFLDSQTVQLSKVDPKIRGQVKELMMKDVKFAPSVSGRNQNTYIEPKRTESQMTKPLSGYRLRDLKTRALTSAVYNNPRPRPLRGVVATVFGATGFLGTQVAAQLSMVLLVRYRNAGLNSVLPAALVNATRFSGKYGAQVVCPVRPNVFGVDPYGRNEFRLLKLYGDQGMSYHNGIVEVAGNRCLFILHIVHFQVKCSLSCMILQTLRKSALS